MATIDIAFTQATLRAVESDDSLQASLGDVVDLFFKTGDDYSSAHDYFSNYGLSGNTLRVNFKDGAVTTFSGVSLADPNASKGAASATSVDQNWPGVVRLSYAGALNYNYQNTGDTLQIDGTTSTITSGTVQTQWPSNSVNYSPVYGNASVSLKGSIQNDGNGNFTGRVDNFTVRADKLLVSKTLDGVFTVSGNSDAIVQNKATTALTGELRNYSEKYVDGSHVLLSNANAPATGATQLDAQFLGTPANFPGNDVFSVTMPDQLSNAILISAGNGDDRIGIKGGGSKLSVDGGNGNDTIVLADDGHAVNGGSGIDTLILGGARSSYTITGNGDAFTVRAPSGLVDTVTQVERVQFSDATLALDVNGNGGQAYRIYQAAFNRAPDLAGVGYWMSAMDHGLTLRDVATAFTQSAEFKSMYGLAPTNHDFLNNLYHNVLHRDGDPAGFAWWLDQLDSHRVSFTDVLMSFSESPENQVALAPAINGGIFYTPWLG